MLTTADQRGLRRYPLHVSGRPIDLQVAANVADLQSIGWDQLAGASPFLASDWLEAFAEAGGPETRYLLFRAANKDEILGICLLQSLPVARMSLGRIPKRVVAATFGGRLQQFGQVLFGGLHGAHFAPTVPGPLLLAAARIALADPAASCSWLSKDLPAGIALPTGWTQIKALPDLVMSIPTAWQSEIDYLTALPSKYRRRARRARRLFDDGLSVRLLDAGEVREQSAAIGVLYEKLLARSPYIPFRAPSAYLPALKRAVGERCEVRGYFHGRSLVGYSTLLVDGEQALAHFAAVDEYYNGTHQLYLNLLLDLLSGAIAAGAARLHYGRTATTIKSSIGAQPREYVSFATHDGQLRRRLLSALNAGVLSRGDAEAAIRRPLG